MCLTGGQKSRSTLEEINLTILFLIQTSDFCAIQSFYLQKYSADSAFVECSVVAEEAGYKELEGCFTAWCGNIHLVLNLNKANEMIMDFRKTIKPDFVSVLGQDFLVLT